MFEILFGLVSIAWFIFMLVVMIEVYQTAKVARTYFERKNREHLNRPTVFDRARSESGIR